jgi:hypothetical protein
VWGRVREQAADSRGKMKRNDFRPFRPRLQHRLLLYLASLSPTFANLVPRPRRARPTRSHLPAGSPANPRLLHPPPILSSVHPPSPPPPESSSAPLSPPRSPASSTSKRKRTLEEGDQFADVGRRYEDAMREVTGWAACREGRRVRDGRSRIEGME